MAKMIIISEDTLTNKIHDLLIEMDADELARIAGEMFGGECYYFWDGYHFYPDENYFDAFGKAEE
jgi:hypothetical protein